MTARDFCYWLQGFFEIRGSLDVPHGALTHQQVEMIRRHLALVFKHEIDPSQGTPEQQAELQTIHDGPQASVVPPPGWGPHGPTIFRC